SHNVEVPRRATETSWQSSRRDPSARATLTWRPSSLRRFWTGSGGAISTSTRSCRSGFQGLFGEAAGDDPQAQGLVGAFEDGQDAGVGEVAGDGELLGVAHAAEEF